jgi:hypothetical protein
LRRGGWRSAPGLKPLEYGPERLGAAGVSVGDPARDSCIERRQAGFAHDPCYFGNNIHY